MGCSHHPSLRSVVPACSLPSPPRQRRAAAAVASGRVCRPPSPSLLLHLAHGSDSHMRVGSGSEKWAPPSPLLAWEDDAQPIGSLHTAVHLLQIRCPSLPPWRLGSTFSLSLSLSLFDRWRRHGLNSMRQRRRPDGVCYFFQNVCHANAH